MSIFYRTNQPSYRGSTSQRASTAPRSGFWGYLFGESTAAYRTREAYRDSLAPSSSRYKSAPTAPIEEEPDDAEHGCPEAVEVYVE